MLDRIHAFLARRRQRAALGAHVAALSEARFEGFRCAVQAGLSRIFVSRGPAERAAIRVPADVVFEMVVLGDAPPPCPTRGRRG